MSSKLSQQLRICKEDESSGTYSCREVKGETNFFKSLAHVVVLLQVSSPRHSHLLSLRAVDHTSFREYLETAMLPLYCQNIFQHCQIVYASNSQTANMDGLGKDLFPPSTTLSGHQHQTPSIIPNQLPIISSSFLQKDTVDLHKPQLPQSSFSLPQNPICFSCLLLPLARQLRCQLLLNYFSCCERSREGARSSREATVSKLINNILHLNKVAIPAEFLHGWQK